MTAMSFHRRRRLPGECAERRRDDATSPDHQAAPAPPASCHRHPDSIRTSASVLNRPADRAKRRHDRANHPHRV